MQPALKPCSGTVYLKTFFKSLCKLKYLNANVSVFGATWMFAFVALFSHFQ